ncbi:hypothetical protein IFM89_009693 [Coptis chinensis]|uniref:Uncharacterized protein n=1 Tax=Coptis chinensis TaxID=261450 RepID=A0A835HS37_9MAGN|nr:hypothetical protein IFM89_009693 [Coptis chinensis]
MSRGAWSRAARMLSVELIWTRNKTELWLIFKMNPFYMNLVHVLLPTLNCSTCLTWQDDDAVNAEAFINKASFLVSGSKHEVLNIQYKVHAVLGYHIWGWENEGNLL